MLKISKKQTKKKPIIFTDMAKGLWYLELLTVFLIFASLKDLEAPLVNRVVKETEAVDSFDNSTGNCSIIPLNTEKNRLNTLNKKKNNRED